MTVVEAIKMLLDHESLTRAQVREVFGQLMSGSVPPVQIGALLTALRMKGETVDEIAGAAEAMRDAAVPIRCQARVIVDTCGTGGDGQGSFNISTAAAFVVAGAGYTVAKHGNRSISSQCGSADILEELGIPMDIEPAKAEACLKEVGLAFLFAPRYHPATRHAMPVRQELGIRTIFNVLGPLTNPARPNVQLVGVYDPNLVKPIAQVLVKLGCRQGYVVHGQGHDEVVLSGSTKAAEIKEEKVTLKTWTPKDFGLCSHPPMSWKGGSRQYNAQIMRDLLQGKPSPFRDAVCANAAAAIRAAYRQTNGVRADIPLKAAFQLAQKSIDDKKAFGKFEALRELLFTETHV